MARPLDVERTDNARHPVRVHLGTGYADMSVETAERLAARLLRAARPDVHLFMVPVPERS